MIWLLVRRDCSSAEMRPTTPAAGNTHGCNFFTYFTAFVPSLELNETSQPNIFRFFSIELNWPQIELNWPQLSTMLFWLTLAIGTLAALLLRWLQIFQLFQAHQHKYICSDNEYISKIFQIPKRKLSLLGFSLLLSVVVVLHALGWSLDCSCTLG